jgi:transcriptional regulator with XRE-family HTH domain
MSTDEALPPKKGSAVRAQQFRARLLDESAKAGLSKVSEIADIAGISRIALYRMLSGSRAPDPEVVRRILEALASKTGKPLLASEWDTWLTDIVLLNVESAGYRESAFQAKKQYAYLRGGNVVLGPRGMASDSAATAVEQASVYLEGVCSGD